WRYSARAGVVLRGARLLPQTEVEAPRWPASSLEKKLRLIKRGTVPSMARPLHLLGTDTPGSFRMESSSSASRPLRLSDTQLALVRRAATLLQPQARSQFLQSIAHELADVDPLTDDAVQRAVDAIMDAAARR